MSRVQLVATDIDGTLLDSGNRLSARNRSAAARAAARGVRFALITARKQHSALQAAAELGVPCAIVTHNGARIQDWNGLELAHLTIPMLDAVHLATIADQQHLPLIITVDEVNYRNPWYPLSAGTDRQERTVERSAEALHAAPSRMITIGDTGIAALHHASMRLHESVVLHRYISREGAHESAVITHREATKGAAVAQLAAATGIDQACVMTLGDADADVSMLQWAGIGVAMGNAMPEALAVADWVAPSNDDDGFAAAIERFVLNIDVR